MYKVIIISVFLFIFAQLNTYAAPAIEIECGGEYNWGTVKTPQKPLEAKIKIFNKGTDTLKIITIRPGCGCTVPNLDKKNIEPGGFGTLDVGLDVSNYEGDVQKAMTLHTNVPGREQVSLGLRVNIYKPLSVFPRFLNYNQMFVGETSVSKLTIKNNSDKPIKFSDIETTPFTIDHNLKDGTVIAPKGEFVLEAKYTPKVAESMNGKIRVNTSDPDQPIMDISVWGISIEKKK